MSKPQVTADEAQVVLRLPPDLHEVVSSAMLLLEGVWKRPPESPIETKSRGARDFFSLETSIDVALSEVHGEVLGIYRYGSVSGKHESFTDAETVDGLSYLSLRVYEQLAPGRNIFQHVSPPVRAGRNPLALFTHAPISELVYLLTGAIVRSIGEQIYSISGGDAGWERWHALTSQAVYRILDLDSSEGGSYEEVDEDDYDEPDEGGSTKKRRPKPPQGAIKKQKMVSGQKATAGKPTKFSGPSKKPVITRPVVKAVAGKRKATAPRGKY
ncbi:hypothetical protein GGX14DRAFT_396482 [Mycena pura]|uniref:Uncharacterized protein n=1 Tax=Mycena pura TaxID=153505 RepID=A0AAD6VAF2_9AGAR|nr:hypothetical protein GGX14DRAFT_396482 [Mycena pura]